MTVQEFIDLLQEIKDKDKPVMLSSSSALTELKWGDNIMDQPHQLLIR